MALISDLIRNFQYWVTNGRLAQGYIFFGNGFNQNCPDIKWLFAQKLANYLENQEWKAPNKPLLDFMEGSYGIDDMRTAINFLWQKPVKSLRRTLVVPKAENLTIEAQNAILKISEEAPPHGLIILLVRDPEVLLPTLVSRFQKIYFSSDTVDEISEIKQCRKIVDEFWHSSVNRRKEILKEVAKDGEFLDNFIMTMLSQLKRDPIQNWRILKELLNRWSLIKRYNTNVRLQLEAALLWIKPLR